MIRIRLETSVYRLKGSSPCPRGIEDPASASRSDALQSFAQELSLMLRLAPAGSQ